MVNFIDEFVGLTPMKNELDFNHSFPKQWRHPDAQLALDWIAGFEPYIPRARLARVWRLANLANKLLVEPTSSLASTPDPSQSRPK